MEIANTPPPPYYAVIFSSVLRNHSSGNCLENDEKNEAYFLTAKKMLDLAAVQQGFLGFESAREELGISVSYWESEEAIRKWKTQTEHQIAQQKGREVWYANYRIRICRVEREYGV